MKYIEAKALIVEIDKIIRGLKVIGEPHPLGSDAESLAAAEIEVLELVKELINQMKQEEPTPPGIKEESKKKGWLHYGLMMDEIGLHRYNAIRRIREHKEQFDPQRVHHLYHVAEYYKAVGAELTCCCLQAYCNDMLFTKEEINEISKQ